MDESFVYFSCGSEGDTSADSETELELEELDNQTEWTPITDGTRKFVDDLLGIEATKCYNGPGDNMCIPARESEVFFLSVKKNTAEIGMSVNA